MAFKNPARVISGLQHTVLRGNFVGGTEANKVRKPGSQKHEASFLAFKVKCKEPILALVKISTMFMAYLRAIA